MFQSLLHQHELSEGARGLSCCLLSCCMRPLNLPCLPIECQFCVFVLASRKRCKDEHHTDSYFQTFSDWRKTRLARSLRSESQFRYRNRFRLQNQAPSSCGRNSAHHQMKHIWGRIRQCFDRNLTENLQRKLPKNIELMRLIKRRYGEMLAFSGVSAVKSL